ncbi:hypothetical protein HNY73_012038 [Argiope bruennichi]|uniref:WAP domain-containing protein n=1 Tax=Argiope bruennichi TaxID=94029 RepID=A0A8T0EZ99_ARGBR|nr:hypothetical protein HNY73_012038 [Argiope bruennichi]
MLPPDLGRQRGLCQPVNKRIHKKRTGEMVAFRRDTLFYRCQPGRSDMSNEYMISVVIFTSYLRSSHQESILPPDCKASARTKRETSEISIYSDDKKWKCPEAPPTLCFYPSYDFGCKSHDECPDYQLCCLFACSYGCVRPEPIPQVIPWSYDYEYFDENAENNLIDIGYDGPVGHKNLSRFIDKKLHEETVENNEILFRNPNQHIGAFTTNFPNAKFYQAKFEITTANFKNIDIYDDIENNLIDIGPNSKRKMFKSNSVSDTQYQKFGNGSFTTGTFKDAGPETVTIHIENFGELNAENIRKSDNGVYETGLMMRQKFTGESNISNELKTEKLKLLSQAKYLLKFFSGLNPSMQIDEEFLPKIIHDSYFSLFHNLKLREQFPLEINRSGIEASTEKTNMYHRKEVELKNASPYSESKNHQITKEKLESQARNLLKFLSGFVPSTEAKDFLGSLNISRIKESNEGTNLYYQKEDDVKNASPYIKPRNITLITKKELESQVMEFIRFLRNLVPSKKLDGNLLFRNFPDNNLTSSGFLSLSNIRNLETNIRADEAKPNSQTARFLNTTAINHSESKHVTKKYKGRFHKPGRIGKHSKNVSYRGRKLEKSSQAISSKTYNNNILNNVINDYNISIKEELKKENKKYSKIFEQKKAGNFNGAFVLKSKEKSLINASENKKLKMLYKIPAGTHIPDSHYTGDQKNFRKKGQTSTLILEGNPRSQPETKSKKPQIKNAGDVETGGHVWLPSDYKVIDIYDKQTVGNFHGAFQLKRGKQPKTTSRHILLQQFGENMPSHIDIQSISSASVPLGNLSLNNSEKIFLSHWKDVIQEMLGEETFSDKSKLTNDAFLFKERKNLDPNQTFREFDSVEASLNSSLTSETQIEKESGEPPNFEELPDFIYYPIKIMPLPPPNGLTTNKANETISFEDSSTKINAWKELVKDLQADKKVFLNKNNQSQATNVEEILSTLSEIDNLKGPNVQLPNHFNEIQTDFNITRPVSKKELLILRLKDAVRNLLVIDKKPIHKYDDYLQSVSNPNNTIIQKYAKGRMKEIAAFLRDQSLNEIQDQRNDLEERMAEEAYTNHFHNSIPVDLPYRNYHKNSTAIVSDAYTIGGKIGEENIINEIPDSSSDFVYYPMRNAEIPSPDFFSAAVEAPVTSTSYMLTDFRDEKELGESTKLGVPSELIHYPFNSVKPLPSGSLLRYRIKVPQRVEQKSKEQSYPSQEISSHVEYNSFESNTTGINKSLNIWYGNLQGGYLGNRTDQSSKYRDSEKDILSTVSSFLNYSFKYDPLLPTKRWKMSRKNFKNRNHSLDGTAQEHIANDTSARRRTSDIETQDIIPKKLKNTKLNNLLNAKHGIIEESNTFVTSPASVIFPPMKILIPPLFDNFTESTAEGFNENDKDYISELNEIFHEDDEKAAFNSSKLKKFLPMHDDMKKESKLKKKKGHYSKDNDYQTLNMNSTESSLIFYKNNNLLLPPPVNPPITQRYIEDDGYEMQNISNTELSLVFYPNKNLFLPPPVNQPEIEEYTKYDIYETQNISSTQPPLIFYPNKNLFLPPPVDLTVTSDTEKSREKKRNFNITSQKLTIYNHDMHMNQLEILPISSHFKNHSVAVSSHYYVANDTSAKRKISNIKPPNFIFKKFKNGRLKNKKISNSKNNNSNRIIEESGEFITSPSRVIFPPMKILIPSLLDNFTKASAEGFDKNDEDYISELKYKIFNEDDEKAAFNSEFLPMFGSMKKKSKLTSKKTHYSKNEGYHALNILSTEFPFIFYPNTNVFLPPPVDIPEIEEYKVDDGYETQTISKTQPPLTFYPNKWLLPPPPMNFTVASQREKKHNFSEVSQPLGQFQIYKQGERMNHLEVLPISSNLTNKTLPMYNLSSLNLSKFSVSPKQILNAKESRKLRVEVEEDRMKKPLFKKVRPAVLKKKTRKGKFKTKHVVPSKMHSSQNPNQTNIDRPVSSTMDDLQFYPIFLHNIGKKPVEPLDPAQLSNHIVFPKDRADKKNLTSKKYGKINPGLSNSQEQKMSKNSIDFSNVNEKENLFFNSKVEVSDLLDFSKVNEKDNLLFQTKQREPYDYSQVEELDLGISNKNNQLPEPNPLFKFNGQPAMNGFWWYNLTKALTSKPTESHKTNKFQPSKYLNQRNELHRSSSAPAQTTVLERIKPVLTINDLWFDNLNKQQSSMITTTSRFGNAGENLIDSQRRKESKIYNIHKSPRLSEISMPDNEFDRLPLNIESGKRSQEYEKFKPHYEQNKNLHQDYNIYSKNYLTYKKNQKAENLISDSEKDVNFPHDFNINQESILTYRKNKKSENFIPDSENYINFPQNFDENPEKILTYRKNKKFEHFIRYSEKDTIFPHDFDVNLENVQTYGKNQESEKFIPNFESNINFPQEFNLNSKNIPTYRKNKKVENIIPDSEKNISFPQDFNYLSENYAAEYENKKLSGEFKYDYESNKDLFQESNFFSENISADSSNKERIDKYKKFLTY